MLHRPLKVSLLGATFATDNRGVDALAAGSIKCILHCFPQASISILDYGKTDSVFLFALDGKRVAIQVVHMRFSKKVYLKNNIALLVLISLALKLLPFDRIRRTLIARNPCLRHICEADIIASVAGGDSFSDTYGLERLLYVSLPQLLVLFLGKRLLLLPQTLGPFRSKTARAIAKFILTRADLIYSRDFTGLREMKALLKGNHCTGKLRFCYDVGFVVDPIAPNHFDLLGFPAQRSENSCLVGLNVSGLLFTGGCSRGSKFALKVEYDRLVRSVIEFLIQRKNAVVMLIPHVIGKGHPEHDSPACEKLYDDLKAKYRGNIVLARGKYNHNEIKYIIGLCGFFIGSRMHACIAAVSQNIPAVAIAYSDKFVGVMQTIGVDSLVVDARTMGQEEILNMIDQAYERRSMVRQHLEVKMPQVKERILNLFGEIERSREGEGERLF